MRKFAFSGLIVVGFTSMVSQIILMRELLVVFYGNELSLGVTLACWFFWVAAGSWWGRAAARKAEGRTALFSAGQTVLAFFLPAAVLAVRLIPEVLKTSPGEIIGMVPMVFAGIILLAPVGVLLGFLFVVGCGIYSRQVSEVGRAYILEAAGATAGGLLAGLVLLRLFSPVRIVTALGLINLICAFLLASFTRTRTRRILLFLVSLLIPGSLFLFFHSDSLNRAALQRQWKNYRLLAFRNSLYAKLVAVERVGQRSLFNNGLLMFAVPDRFTSEMTAHLALLEHPCPESVLLMGGGGGEVLEEILKHRVKRIDYLELDPVSIEMTRSYMRGENQFSDPRVRVRKIDGRLHVKRADRSYDVIIVNLPEPFTAQLNRFYTVEFFREAEKILHSGGILFFKISSNPNYISEEQRKLLICLKASLEKVFAEVIVLPGETNYFLACNNEGVLTEDWRILIGRLQEREIEAKYFREYYLESEFSGERLEYLNNRIALAPEERVTLNNDFRPICYFYDMILWSTHFRFGFRRLFSAVTSAKIYLAALIVFALLLMPVWLRKTERKVRSLGVLTAIATTGFAEISFQVITLLAFQIIYGYVYYKLSIILTSFMLGLILGGLCVTRMLEKGRGDRITFIRIQMVIILYPLILPVLFSIFAGSKGVFSVYVGSNLVFPFLPVIAGFIGGFQFPLANKLHLEKGGGIIPAVGLIYALDLVGSCAGAILVSVFLLPILGIFSSCVLIALLNFISLILVSYRKKFFIYKFPHSPAAKRN